MSVITYLLSVHYCIGTKRKNSKIKKIKLEVQKGLNDYDLKEMIKQDINTERKITIVSKKKVNKGNFLQSQSYGVIKNMKPGLFLGKKV